MQKFPHKIPKDLEKIISKKEIKNLWNAITPLAQNEWICLIESAKREDTRVRRLSRAYNQIKQGQKRPCCWAGCPHRE